MFGQNRQNNLLHKRSICNLSDARQESFLLEMLPEGFRLFGDWKTANPNWCNILASDGYSVVAKGNIAHARWKNAR
jgi:hypothetical protein